MKYGALAKDTLITIGGIPYTFNSFITFYESGKVEGGSLAKDTTVIIGGISYTFANVEDKYIDIFFYESGKVNGGGLANPLAMSIGGKGYQFDRVYFDSEGTIIQIQLSAPITIKGKKYEKGSRVQLYNDGSFAKGGYDKSWTGKKK